MDTTYCVSDGSLLSDGDTGIEFNKMHDIKQKLVNYGKLLINTTSKYTGISLKLYLILKETMSTILQHYLNHTKK